MIGKSAIWDSINSAHKVYAFSATPLPKYIANLEAGAHLDLSNVLRAKGPFLNAVYAREQSSARLISCVFDGVLQLMTLLTGSRGTFYANTVALPNMDDFAAFAADQTGIYANTARLSALFAGAGCTIETGANTFTGGRVNYAVHIMGGKNLSVALDTWDGVYNALRGYQYYCADCGVMNGKFINSAPGSNDSAYCSTSALQFVAPGYAMSGGFSPALAADTLAGSGFTTAVT